MKHIGFIGTGVMGKSMAGHLLEKGYHIHLYTRTRAKAEDLLEKGAEWHETPAALAGRCDAVITMVGYPKDVEEVYFGEEGILSNAREGTLLIDMTTSRPDLAVKIAAEAEKRKLFALDAPVSGGDIGAKNAALAIMSGGSKKAFTLAEPLFKIMGENIQLLGDAGAGQFTKMANQIAIASTMMGVSESLAYAKAAGLDTAQVINTIETGAAGSFSLSKLGRRMLEEDFEPGFYVKHFIKDMRIAIESAKEMNLNLPGLALAESLYTRMSEAGYEDAGTQVLIKYYFQK
ncbi:NAD(P)-dependent oxidoreductase [Alkalicoccus daliensis]|uniref:3-hydroxyisobutyrate dehydrogenase n=1 Tax=Alkalicoccus daliensis TaxID=745820 RepID=A0A1H0K497_9BACI|nr:NAD(P)-dependent oxidoreductase [Alkalicoccus daliensis]SDO50590.1 3-hydroxyisobutyrate dehydrogenase [Alkalicoccus daliensis]